jgi:hypothetical protein
VSGHRLLDIALRDYFGRWMPWFDGSFRRQVPLFPYLNAVGFTAGSI